MPKTLVELAAEIVGAQASQRSMDSDEISQAIYKVFKALKNAKTEEEEGKGDSLGKENTEDIGKTTTPKSSIQKHRIICLECGEAFKQLGRRHLSGHGLTPKEYRGKHGIPLKQALAAKSVSEQRKRIAIERGLGKRLAEVRKKKAAERAAQMKSST
tara:strand:+ start:357 stop:827 length:471 start_codon:yes stop_codon:yes gene_type:complete